MGSVIRTLRLVLGVVLAIVALGVFVFYFMEMGYAWRDGEWLFLVLMPLAALLLLALAWLLTFWADNRSDRRRVEKGRALIDGLGLAETSLLLDYSGRDIKGPFVLELLPDRAVLHAIESNMAKAIPIAQAEERILLPGFAENRSALEIVLGNRTMAFANPGAATRMIRDWFDAAMLIHAPKKLPELRRRAILSLRLGAAGMIGAIGMTVISQFWANVSGDEYYYIYIGTFGVGLAASLRGWSQLRRYNRLSAMMPPDALPPETEIP